MTKRHGVLTKTQLQEYEFPSIWKRLGANIIDSVVVSVIGAPFLYVTVGISLSAAKTLTETGADKIIFSDDQVRDFMLFSILYTAVDVIYHIVLPATKLQGTIGKRVLKMKIISTSGHRITLKASAIRFVVMQPLSLVLSTVSLNPRVASGTIGSLLSLPQVVYHIANAYTATQDDYTRTWHDRAAKTYVVER